ncbi:hypothetical protein CIG75_00415 [Tumebacillus algifaecis]|uniref:Uncharacterized protein n=1 Tax=Tumebacillus algifaecis TaxID=1214604 RepID=A0A223CWL2_9BACL|nr:hypothetical protein [Tumebacillus algifaecis]ASS73587.1 hypothetical protein CIG75_00415 [Tumebacillus algifaecis]
MTVVLGVHILAACVLALYLVFPFFPWPLLHKVGHYSLLLAFFSGIWLVASTRPPVWWLLLTFCVFLAFSAVLGSISRAMNKGRLLHRIKWVPALLYLTMLVLMGM